MRIGILGGTFDPIHVGHIAIATTAVAELCLDQLLIIPSRTPPHKPQPSTTPQQRLDMCHLGCRGIPQCEVSDIELKRSGPSYTIDTLRTLAHHGDALVLILGVDAALLLPHWHEANQLTRYAEIAIVERLGSPVDVVPQLIDALPSLAGHVHRLAGPGLEVSSSDIRARCTRGDAIDTLVPEAVAEYIATHRLYHTPQSHN